MYIISIISFTAFLFGWFMPSKKEIEIALRNAKCACVRFIKSHIIDTEENLWQSKTKI